MKKPNVGSPREVLDNIISLDKHAIDCISLVHDFYEGRSDKTLLWFTTQNPHLGMIRPIRLLQIGKSMKLYVLIRNCLDGNFA